MLASTFSRIQNAESYAFLASGSILLVGLFVANVSNYLFTFIVSRLVSPSEFGEVTALFSLLIIVSVPGAALTMFIARHTAHTRARNGSSIELLKRLRSSIVRIALVMWVLCLLAVPLIASLLSIPTTPVFIFSVLIPLSLLGALQTGAIQGLQNFWAVSTQNVIGALVKLLGSIALVLAGYSVSGIMAAVALGSLLSVVYGYAHLRRLPESEATAESPALDWHGYRAAFAATLLIALLSNIDVLIAKHYLSAVDAGFYGVLSTTGKMLIYGISAFISVVIPAAADAHARGDGSESRVLRNSLLVITLISAAVLVIFALVPELVVSLLFGARYLPVAPLLPYFGIGMYLFAVATNLANYFIALHHQRFVYAFALGVAVEILLLLTFHDSLAEITGVIVASGLIVVGLLATEFATRARRTV